MTNEKNDRLFKAARNEAPPAPDAAFDTRVMAAIRRSTHQQTFSILDRINLLFPRIVFASAAIIASCLLIEVGVGMFSHSDLSSKVAEISEQWIFAAN